MRSLCQDTAKPMSMRCWNFCRVKVSWVSKLVGVNAKPMSRICAADVKIMRSRCRDACEADINTNAKPMSRRQTQAVSCMCRRAWIMEIHTNTLMPDGHTQTDICSCQSLHCLLGFLLVLYRNIVSTIERASRSNVRPGFLGFEAGGLPKNQ